jgi:hypothetical protein
MVNDDGRTAYIKQLLDYRPTGRISRRPLNRLLDGYNCYAETSRPEREVYTDMLYGYLILAPTGPI